MFLLALLQDALGIRRFIETRVDCDARYLVLVLLSCTKLDMKFMHCQSYSIPSQGLPATEHQNHGYIYWFVEPTSKSRHRHPIW